MAKPLSEFTLEELNDEFDLGHEWYTDGEFYSDAERIDILKSTYDESTQNYSLAAWIEHDDLFESVEDAMSELDEMETQETY